MSTILTRTRTTRLRAQSRLLRMRIIMVSNHIIPSSIRLAAPGLGAGKVLIAVVMGHVPIEVLLPEETSAALVAFERSITGSGVAFFVISKKC